MNLAAKQFDLVNARVCAAAAAYAYTTRPAEGTFIEAGDNRVVVLESTEDNHIIIAFRGTMVKSIRNWITDAEFFRELLVEEANGDRCEVHAGFLKAFESVIEKLTTHLRLIKAGDRPIFICGHSLGGALAKLAALKLKRQKFNVVQVYTFGQPRVGNAAFKRLYEWSLGDRTFRLVYQEDIVPRVPHIPHLTDPYRHVGTEIFFPSNRKRHVVNPSLWRLLVSDAWGIYRAFIVRKFAAAFDPVYDHAMNNYLDALEAAHD